MAKEMTKDTTPKNAGYMERGINHARKQEAIKREEEEIEALMKEQRGEVPKEEEVEEVVVDRPDAETEEPPKEEEKLSREEQTFKKRYGDLRKHMANKEAEWKQKLEASSKDDLRMPAKDEDIEAWASKHPEIASIVETIASKKADEKFAKADERFKELDSVNEAAQRLKAENAIREVHTDFDELRESDKFHDWVEDQPQVVQDSLYLNSEDPKSVIRVLDLYKMDNGLTPEARKTKAKDAAKTVSKHTRTTPVDDDAGKKMMESVVSKMSDKEFEENADKINAALREGNFVYDVTGGAR